MFTASHRRTALAAGTVLAVAGAIAFPGAAGAATGPVKPNPGIAIGLNPQPLPPRWVNPLVRVGLNPQPLPPRVALF